MNVSPGGLATLLSLRTEAITVTVPAPFGVIAVQLVLAAHSTLLAFLEPNLKPVVPTPGAKAKPVIVTFVPPDNGPLEGLTALIVGAGSADLCDSREAADRHGRFGARGDAAVAELPSAVGAPRHDRAQQRKAVTAPGRDRTRVADAFHGNRQLAEAFFFPSSGPSHYAAVAQLAEFVGAPRHHLAVAEQRQAVFAAGGDRGDTRQAFDGYRCFAFDGRAVAELAGFVAAPGDDGAVVQQCEALIGARGDRFDFAHADDVHRDVTAGFFAIAQLAGGIRPPGVDAPSFSNARL